MRSDVLKLHSQSRLHTAAQLWLLIRCIFKKRWKIFTHFKILPVGLNAFLFYSTIRCSADELVVAVSAGVTHTVAFPTPVHHQSYILNHYIHPTVTGLEWNELHNFLDLMFHSTVASPDETKGMQKEFTHTACAHPVLIHGNAWIVIIFVKMISNKKMVKVQKRQHQTNLNNHTSRCEHEQWHSSASDWFLFPLFRRTAACFHKIYALVHF